MHRAVITLLFWPTLFLWTAVLLDSFAWANQVHPETFVCKKLDTQVSSDKRNPQKNRWIYDLFSDEEVFLVRDFVGSARNKKGKKLSGKLNDQMMQRGAFEKGFSGRERDLFASVLVALLEDDSLLVVGGKYRVKYFCDGAYERVWNAASNLAAHSQVDKTYLAQKKIEELEAKLATLQNVGNTNVDVTADAFRIQINKALTIGPEGIIEGQVFSESILKRVAIEGRPLEFNSEGHFRFQTYVPDGGINVEVEAVDVTGRSTSLNVQLNRAVSQASVLVFDRLNPISRSAVENANAVALVVGISNYRETSAQAVYADGDAKVFLDYAAEKLGVPRGRIKTLVNDQANEKEILLASKRWLSRMVRQNQSDIYIFFAGHGLASEDGKNMYMLPYDGAPELLDKTAILREELFADVAAANPRSVTVFLDTCYSGTTRGPDMLIASRPIAIKAKKQAVPEGFTVMTAAAGDQTAKPLEEAKHGMFSYFLMKGMEGDADANQDNQITAGELHVYVQQNVIQQSSGNQTPELQGDAERVLVRFQ